MQSQSKGISSPEDRQKAITADMLDLLIIGGGIVGSGIARDAAMRGMRVGLVERHDFAYGTSSRSSRLLHGGLRYLAQGRIGLVHEASVEKKIIHQIAPHISDPLPFIFPTYRGEKDWVLWQLKIGVKIYDLLCGGRNLGKSTWLHKNEVLKNVPALSPEGLQGAVRYYDGFTNDARLTLDTLRSAVKRGAVVLNYCRYEGATRDEAASVWKCDVQDALADKPFQILARSVVNATGPWADGLPHSQVKLRVTKGVHLVVERARVPVPDTVVMTEGKRILFAIPWGERTIIGTTDTDYEGSPEDVSANAEDIRYVLKITNQYFPNAKLTEPDLISAWAGLRPLVADPHGRPSDVSRSHEIHNPAPGWWDVAGGKLTTYRLMAEQTVDQVVKSLKSLPGPHSPTEACRTAHEPLLPPEETAGLSSILPPEFSRRLVEHFVTNEWAVHLDDVMVRRTKWHYYHRDAAAKAEIVAGWMAGLLGWAAIQRETEITRYHELADCLPYQKASGTTEILRRHDQQRHSVV